MWSLADVNLVVGYFNFLSLQCFTTDLVVYIILTSCGSGGQRRDLAAVLPSGGHQESYVWYYQIKAWPHRPLSFT